MGLPQACEDEQPKHRENQDVGQKGLLACPWTPCTRGAAD